jgi:hypothetical protein
MSEATNKLSSYTIFCGVILLGQKIRPAQPEGLLDWTTRLDQPQSFLQYLKKSYYKNFLANVAPETSPQNATNAHFTVTSFRDSPREATIVTQGKTIGLHIPYVDIFLFPDNVGIFSFRTNLNERDASYEIISSLINHLRQPLATIRFGSNELTVSEFIKQSTPSSIALREDWDEYMPQLKAYTIINDHSTSAFNESLDRILYELSHVLPIGASRESEFSPTEAYYHQIAGNAISIFNNWKAIALFDTFTRISCSYPDQYKAWEQEYFLIYVHGLYTKYQLYAFNSRLNAVATVSRKTKLLRDRFIEFVNDYHLAYISYKFHKELDRMEVKLERIHQAFGEKKSQQINQLLLVLSLLGIFSLVTDLSAWLTQMGLPAEVVYSPIVPIGLVGAILLAGYWIYKRRVG